MCTMEQDLGKFEAETCITHLAYDWAMAGFGEDYQGEESDPPTSIFRGPFTLQEMRDADIPLCAECIADVLSASKIMFWEDTQGFAYSIIE